ncbi:MAG TPA: rRNA maturation RNase YbeY [Anaerolineaceae bacterium]|nr:rRNA maturation RNase YbeY [Anaerolineaceae bacterium]
MIPEVNIQNFQKFNIPKNIEQTVNSSLSILNKNLDITVNISFVDEVEMSTLNNNFRNIQSPTDVLSFEAGIIDPENGKTILGDIVICYPFVTQQAKESENDIHDELRLMVIHGLLHLLGYDHEDEESKQIMWEKQNKILMAEKIFLNRIPE